MESSDKVVRVKPEFHVTPHRLTKKLVPLDNQLNANLEEPLPKVSHSWGIIGGRGTGKTSLVVNALKNHFRRYFDNIWLISKTAKGDSLTKQDLAALLEELEPENKFHTTLTDEVARDIIETVQSFNGNFDRRKAKREPRSLVILDDQLSNLPKGRMGSTINDLIVNGRHLRLSVWVLTQKYNSLPTLWRSNLQLLSVFGTQNKKELATLEEDLNIDRDKLHALFEFATMGRHSFLHLNFFANPPIAYRKFDRITEA